MDVKLQITSIKVEASKPGLEADSAHHSKAQQRLDRLATMRRHSV